MVAHLNYTDTHARILATGLNVIRNL